MKNKSFCTTHHLYYSEIECPLCRNERINAYAKRFNKKKVGENDRTINETDLNRLFNKFNKAMIYLLSQKR